MIDERHVSPKYRSNTFICNNFCAQPIFLKRSTPLRRFVLLKEGRTIEKESGSNRTRSFPSGGEKKPMIPAESCPARIFGRSDHALIFTSNKRCAHPGREKDFSAAGLWLPLSSKRGAIPDETRRGEYQTRRDGATRRAPPFRLYDDAKFLSPVSP